MPERYSQTTELLVWCLAAVSLSPCGEPAAALHLCDAFLQWVPATGEAALAPAKKMGFH